MREDDIRNRDENGNIQLLLESSSFHSTGGIEDDGLENDDAYIDIAENSEEEILSEFGKSVSDAESKAILQGTKRLR